jgi:hypothetical protein
MSLANIKLPEGNWKPRWYVCKVTTGALPGNVGENTVTLDARDFICGMITHAIEGVAKDYQHGDYAISIRDNKTTYQNLPINANAMLGSVFDSRPLELPRPIYYQGSSTITVSTQNLRNRSSEVSGPWILDLVLVGFEKVD